MLRNGFQATVPQSHFLFHSFLVACSRLQNDNGDYYHKIFSNRILETFKHEVTADSQLSLHVTSL